MALAKSSSVWSDVFFSDALNNFIIFSNLSIADTSSSSSYSFNWIASLYGSFCIARKNTVLSSNGKVTRYDKKLGYYVLIAKPNFGCSTKLIYLGVRNYSQSKYNYPNKFLFNKSNIIKSKNELENVVFKKYSKLKNLKSYLSKLQNIIFVRMSGSGSSIVVYFYSKKALDIAAKEFKRKYNNYWCIKSKTI